MSYLTFPAADRCGTYPRLVHFEMEEGKEKGKKKKGDVYESPAFVKCGALDSAAFAVMKINQISKPTDLTAQKLHRLTL